MSQPTDPEENGSSDDRVTFRAGGSEPGGGQESRNEGEPNAQGGGSGSQEEQGSGDGQQSSSEGQDTGGRGGEGGGSQQESESGEGGGPGPTPAQWAVGIGSSLLVLALLGFVVYEAVRGTRSPPLVAVRVEQIHEAPQGYVVELGVYNAGGTTASALVIEGTLKRDTTTVETSSATISYVPAETEREAGLFFSKDPRRYRLEVRPKGYDHP